MAIELSLAARTASAKVGAGDPNGSAYAQDRGGGVNDKAARRSRGSLMAQGARFLAQSSGGDETTTASRSSTSPKAFKTTVHWLTRSENGTQTSQTPARVTVANNDAPSPAQAPQKPPA